MRWRLHFATAAGLVSTACLYWLPPWQYGFYPRCPVFALTHLQCPGCGMTRAVAALLHGQLAASWHYNPLALSLLPFVVAYLVTSYWQAIRRREWITPQLRRPVILGIMIVVMLFTVARNVYGTVN